MLQDISQMENIRDVPLRRVCFLCGQYAKSGAFLNRVSHITVEFHPYGSPSSLGCSFEERAGAAAVIKEYSHAVLPKPLNALVGLLRVFEVVTRAVREGALVAGSIHLLEHSGLRHWTTV